MKPLTLTLLLTFLLFAFTACSTVNTGTATGTGSSFSETKLADKAGGNISPYPFDHCAVIQKPFSEKPVRHRRVYKGQEVLFCCTPCVRAFDANPDPYMPRIVAAAN